MLRWIETHGLLILAFLACVCLGLLLGLAVHGVGCFGRWVGWFGLGWWPLWTWLAIGGVAGSVFGGLAWWAHLRSMTW